MNITPKTHEEKIARASRKLTRAIQSQDADQYFWYLVDWAFHRVNEKDTPQNLSFYKDVSKLLHERNQPKQETDLSELVALINARFENMNTKPHEEF